MHLRPGTPGNLAQPRLSLLIRWRRLIGSKRLLNVSPPCFTASCPVTTSRHCFCLALRWCSWCLIVVAVRDVQQNLNRVMSDGWWPVEARSCQFSVFVVDRFHLRHEMPLRCQQGLGDAWQIGVFFVEWLSPSCCVLLATSRAINIAFVLAVGRIWWVVSWRQANTHTKRGALNTQPDNQFGWAIIGEMPRVRLVEIPSTQTHSRLARMG
ncbi:unnamed protein product [Mesocestoides corti]|uniref:Secreted protein n=1 Tax=Mesocestoides corti TaxID=53468 RepID=A0A0R3U8A7_MESCO|nr:unnamed protein product [Mesocestoides corti]